MTVIPNESVTPYNESRALRKKLEGVRVYASTYPSGRTVPVDFVNPDMELRRASYPGIYLSYAGTSKADDREVRGPAGLMYAPSGFDTHILVPEDSEDPDNSNHVYWDDQGFGRLNSPYWVPDHPVPVNLDFNVTVVTRNYQEMFQIIEQLQHIDRIPERFGGLEVPEDGTVRTLDLLGGPETSAISDEDSKRLIQSVYSVRVAAELILYPVQEIQRVTTVDITFDQIPYL